MRVHFLDTKWGHRKGAARAKVWCRPRPGYCSVHAFEAPPLPRSEPCLRFWGRDGRTEGDPRPMAGPSGWARVGPHWVRGRPNRGPKSCPKCPRTLFRNSSTNFHQGQGGPSRMGVDTFWTRFRAAFSARFRDHTLGPKT